MELPAAGPCAPAGLAPPAMGPGKGAPGAGTSGRGEPQEGGQPPVCVAGSPPRSAALILLVLLVLGARPEAQETGVRRQQRHGDRPYSGARRWGGQCWGGGGGGRRNILLEPTWGLPERQRAPCWSLGAAGGSRLLGLTAPWWEGSWDRFPANRWRGLIMALEVTTCNGPLIHFLFTSSGLF